MKVPGKFPVRVIVYVFLEISFVGILPEINTKEHLKLRFLEKTTYSFCGRGLLSFWEMRNISRLVRLTS